MRKGPAYGMAVQLEKASPFKGVRDDRHMCGIIGGESVEVQDGEEEVLVGVCCVNFCRYAVVMVMRETVGEIL